MSSFRSGIASYRYSDKVYHFLVNGQTGEVQGQAPISWNQGHARRCLSSIVVMVAIFLAPEPRATTAPPSTCTARVFGVLAAPLPQAGCLREVFWGREHETIPPAFPGPPADAVWSA